MEGKKLKVGIIGRTQILYNTISLLMETDQEVAFIITGRAAPEYTKTENDFMEMADANKIPFMCTEYINSQEAVDFIKSHSPDIGISLNWKTMVKSASLECFPLGVINAHFGDLPRYRGNAVPNWAILQGEKEIVITLHLMDEGLDSGPILVKKEYPVGEKTYIGDFYDYLYTELPNIYIETLDKIEKGIIKPSPQSKDPGLALRCYPRMPIDGEIDWNLSADELCKLIRASSEPFAGAYTFLDDKKMIVWRAHHEDSPTPFVGKPGSITQVRLKTGEVAVATGRGFLVLEEIEIEGEGRRKASDIIRSLRTRLGLNISQQIMNLKRRVKQLENQLQETGKSKN